jgi:hypothetical protein
MKLYGAAMVRNEADIIEAFVRHNLTVLDGLSIIDHGSVDATPAILAALAREGLPIEVSVETSLEFRQSDVVSRAVRRVFSATDAAFVFLLDADEFLKIPSRPRLEAALACLPRDVHAVQEWHTYVPDFSRPLDPVSLIRTARKVALARDGAYKAVVSRHFLDSPTLIAEGNHLVQRRLGAEAYPEVRHARLTPEESAIAHVPIRSAAQFSAKIAIGWLACLMQPDRAPGQSFHWRDAYADLRAGKTPTPDTLTLLAASYGLPEGERLDPDAIRFVDEPFLADVAIVHEGAARADPRALVLQFAEQLAQRVRDLSPANLSLERGELNKEPTARARARAHRRGA